MRRLTGKFLLALVIVLALFTSKATAAGTVTVTKRDIVTGVTEYTIAWTSTAGGAVSSNLFEVRYGRFEQVKFIPGGTTPTDLYDVTIVDENAVDLLQGTGANLSNTTTRFVQFNPGAWQNGRQRIDLVVANAGASKTGTVVLTVIR